jgi:histidyl-tRNA synthetase
LESIGLSEERNEARRLIVLRALDKVDRLGAHGVSDLLQKGRKDDSGDFTRGAELDDSQVERLIWFVGGANPKASPQESYYQRFGISNLAPSQIPHYGKALFEIENLDRIARLRFIAPENELFQQGLDELAAIAELIRSTGYEHARIGIDPAVVRGLEYYTGPVFEVELTFSTDGKDGSPRFGSVGGGGRYDGLVSRFRGEPVPATGFSIGVSRLLAALEYLGKVETKAEAGPVVVTVFDKDRIADYQQMVAKLRKAGIRAELYLGSGKFGPQMKYADRRNAPCVVIQGSDEKAKGEVTIKDLIVGAELAKLEKGRDEHLQKQAEAQRAVPEAQLVEAVRAVLARHKLGPR